jgi:hypothetical protein
MAGRPVLDKYTKLADTETGLPSTGRLRLFLEGGVGTGKTFFGASWPRAAFLDIEHKTSAIRKLGEGSMLFHFKTGREYLDLINELVKDGQAGKCPFDTVVIDTVMGLRDKVKDYLTEWYREKGLLKEESWDITDYKSDGAGWSCLNTTFSDLFERIYHQGGLGWIALDHISPKWRKVGGGESCFWESSLNPAILGYFHKQCEFCAYFETGLDEVSVKLPPKALGTGKVIPGGVGKETRKIYKLAFLPPGSKLPDRVHIPFELPALTIPEGQGFETFNKAYQAAKAAWEKTEKETESGK